MRSFAPASSLALLSILSACGTPGAASDDSRSRPPGDEVAQPHILLLMADQFRGDALGVAGNAAVLTPHLDELARGGCYFPRAYSSTPSCTPARAALLTGRSPWGHGMLGYHRVAPSYSFEFPRALRAAGYRTHAIGKNHFHPPGLPPRH